MHQDRFKWMKLMGEDGEGFLPNQTEAMSTLRSRN